MPQKTKETPMMAQYNAIKKQYSDAFLFFRLGDFYELFNGDALKAAQILEITLTSRNKNADDPIPMCGVPYHAAKEYVKTLVELGYKVAIAEQMEDPKQAQGMVKREVVRLITPGTYMAEGSSYNENNYITALVVKKATFGLAYSDIATGELKVTHVPDFESVLTEFAQLKSKELIISQPLSDSQLERLNSLGQITVSMHQTNEEKLVDDMLTLLMTIDKPIEREATMLLLSYVTTTQFRQIDHWQKASHYDVSHYLHMDYYAKRNLELTESIRTQKRQGSLLAFLDETQTAMGARLLKHWLDRPLISKKQIEQRHQQVSNLIDHYFVRMEIRQQLKGVYDLERLVAKIAMGNVNARELLQLKNSLQRVPAITDNLATVIEDTPEENGQTWGNIRATLFDMPEVVALIENAIDDDAPVSLKDGNVIQDGFDKILDGYRDAMKNGKEWIANLQKTEREKTGIKSLKIGYNKVFGYYIEVTKANLHLLEEGRYERKQTLTNAERYITPELKEVESRLLEAEEKSIDLEYELFSKVREEVKVYKTSLQDLAKSVASIDVLQSLAHISEQHQFTRPIMHNDDNLLKVMNSRHPVVEGVIGRENFVPNNIEMDETTNILLITGPNMSGKSTYMRQLGLIAIMAQMGCFVPATTAELPIFDQIFTRIGAADDLLAGQSTFMVEMMEANAAIQNATDHSLLLFDEIGRGTSTYDGIALAQAILEHVHEHLQAKLLFSTHYHELTALDQDLSGLRNIHVGASEKNGELVFLHKVFSGAADKSYGIHVAKLAGMPQSLLDNAKDILTTLEANNKDNVNSTEQLSLFNVSENRSEAVIERSRAEKNVTDHLYRVDINQLTPMEALNLVNELTEQLKED